MFCICTPFGPPSLLEMPQKEVMFKSKHKLDLGNVSFEQRGKDLFGYNETEFSSKGIYDLVHPEDLSYVAQAHSECKYKCKSWFYINRETLISNSNCIHRLCQIHLIVKYPYFFNRCRNYRVLHRAIFPFL